MKRLLVEEWTDWKLMRKKDLDVGTTCLYTRSTRGGDVGWEGANDRGEVAVLTECTPGLGVEQAEAALRTWRVW